MHAYPFLIVAAVYAGVTMARWVWAQRAGADPTHIASGVGAKLLRTAAVLGVLGGFVYVLPALRNLEDLAHGNATWVAAGSRDGVWFAEGWHRREWVGNQRMRRSRAERARLRLVMLRGRPYHLLIRMDPLPNGGGSRQSLQVRLNDRPVGRLRLRYSEDRIGAYELRVPAAAVRSGFNNLELVAVARTGANGGESTSRPDVIPTFRLWYVRMTPEPALPESQ